MRVLLDTIDPEASLNRVEIGDVDPFHTWVRGRVAILGDTAYHTSPDIGQGACSALEDTFALAITLATNTISVEDSLLRYQMIRSDRAADLVLRARKRCQETHAFDPEATQAWYDRLRTEDLSGIIRGIVGNIVDSPINLGGGGLEPEGVDLRCCARVVQVGNLWLRGCGVGRGGGTGRKPVATGAR